MSISNATTCLEQHPFFPLESCWHPEGKLHFSFAKIMVRALTDLRWRSAWFPQRCGGARLRTESMGHVPPYLDSTVETASIVELLTKYQLNLLVDAFPKLYWAIKDCITNNRSRGCFWGSASPSIRCYEKTLPQFSLTSSSKKLEGHYFIVRVFLVHVAIYTSRVQNWRWKCHPMSLLWPSRQLRMPIFSSVTAYPKFKLAGQIWCPFNHVWDYWF